MKKNKAEKPKNETLVGLIMQSQNSGAVYYWKKGEDVAETIVGVKDRPKGNIVPFDQRVCIDKNNNIIVNPSFLPWAVLKEIHK